MLHWSLKPGQPYRPQVSKQHPRPTDGHPALRPKQVDAYAAMSVSAAPCILTTPECARSHERGNGALSDEQTAICNPDLPDDGNPDRE